MTYNRELLSTEIESEDPKILIVDDKPENLVALERLLKNLGVRLYKALSGNEALKLTLHNDFALALLDIQMPGMDGYDLAEILRSDDKTASLPFIFISAIYTDHINIFKGYEKGAFSYITKPFEPKILINKVEFFIEKYRQEHALTKAYTILERKVDELKTLNEELDAYSYSVAHDLKSPLRAISSYSEILYSKVKNESDKEGQQIVERIRNISKGMSTLIDDILDLSRLNKFEKKNQNINMGDLFTTVFEELKNNVKKRNIKFVKGDMKPVKGDVRMIRQLVTNLLSNALKYTRTKKTTLIEVGGIEMENEYVYFVEDNGVGFNDKYKNKLFHVFERLHKPSEFEGNGVGLAICKRVVKRHNGRIWAESKLNKGTTFYFSFG
jgi:signal transduction histidine kinase